MKIEGTQENCALPSAKDFLRENHKEYIDMDFRLLKQAIATKCVVPEDSKQLKQLQNWVRDERKRLKSSEKQKDVDVQKFSKHQDTKEQAEQIFAEYEDQVLSNILTFDEKKKDEFLRHEIQNNFLLLLKFLKHRSNAPNDDFLPRLLNLCYEMVSSIEQTFLFLRICALHSREVLQVNQNLVEAALIELSAGAVDQDGAYGLMKIAFQNQIPFNSFPLDNLLAFQEIYQHQFKRFLNSLPKIKPFILKCIPATCFIFTKPFFLELENQGTNLQENMDPSYLPSFVKLLAYSFENDHNTFDEILPLFKQGCLKILRKGFDLVVLLDAITEQEVERNPLFFGSLKSQVKLLNQVFDLIGNKKISEIDSNLIDELLSMSNDSYIKAQQAPKIIGDTNEEKKYQSYIIQFKKKNQLPELDDLQENWQVEGDQIQLLKQFRIQGLSYIQRAAWMTIDHFFDQGLNKLVLQFETGAGKTTFALLFLLHHCHNNKVKSIYVNHSDELCFRDYNKAAPVAQELGLTVAYIVSEEDLAECKGNNFDIVFTQTQIYHKMAEQDDWQLTISESLVLLDECDESFFSTEATTNHLLSFSLSKYLIAITGSSLVQVQSKILQQGLKTIVLQYPYAQILDGKQNECVERNVFATRKKQVLHIADICSKQTLETPVLLILEKEGHKAFFEVTKSLPIKNFDQLDPTEIEAFLKGGFLQKQQGKEAKQNYYTCLLNETQGRGLDVPTNAEIETNGGIAVVIAKMPHSYQEFEQFKGRTKRLGNKGMHYIALWDAKAKESCNELLTFHLETAKNKEFIRLNSMLNEVILNNKKEMSSQKCLKVRNTSVYDNYNDENSDRGDDNDESYDPQLKFQRKHEKKETADKIRDQKKEVHSQQHMSIEDLMMSEDESNKIGDKDEPFDAQKLGGELVKFQQKQAKEGNSKKKREQKEQDKEDKLLEKQEQNIAQSKKQSASVKIDKKRTGVSKEQEDCKFCEEPLIEPHVCKKMKDVQSQLQASQMRDIDIDEQYALQKVIDFQQKNMSGEDIINLDERSLEIKVGMFGALENTESLLQKRHKDTRETELVEKTIRKSARNQRQQVEVSQKKTQRELIDEGYFKNYSDLSIHKEMLNDEVRVEMYQKAIELACKDKQVLDLGCGSGVLSAFAVKSGAVQVYAVDNADIKNIMTEQLGKMEVDFTKIKYIQGSIESLTTEEIPQVDVIVSEWMGYFLLFENMIGSYIYAKKYLKADGIMIPQQAGLHLHPAAYDTKGNKITKKHLQGKHKVVKVALCEPENLIQEESVVIHTLDFAGADLQNPLDQGFSQDFGIAVGKSGLFNAFVGSFDVKLYEGVFLNTMPTCQETHWKQSLFFIDNPIQVSEGDTIEGTIKVNVDQENYRNLIVKFTYEVEGKGGSKAEECFTFE